MAPRAAPTLPYALERFDERTRDDAGSSENLPKGSSDAGWLGMPFTQEEDEEDWVGMVDWQALAASTSEPSSSCRGLFVCVVLQMLV